MPLTPIPRRLLAALTAAVVTLSPAAAVAQETSPGPSAAPTAAASTEPTPIPTPVASAEGAWVVTAYDAWQTGLAEPLPGSLLRLSFLRDGLLRGETACGRFDGGWASEGTELYAGIAPGSTFGCADEQTGEAIGLSTALDAVVAWQPDDLGGIELLDGVGTTRLILQPLDAGDPAGRWRVTRFRRPNGEWAEPIPDQAMELHLLPDGLFEGGTGCRLLFGLYTYDAGDITIGPFETDGLPCDGEVARAERQLLRALGVTTTWQGDDETLTLSSETEPVVELVRAPEAGG